MSTTPDPILSFESVKQSFTLLASAITHSLLRNNCIKSRKTRRQKCKNTRQEKRRPIVIGEVFPCGTILADLGTDKHGNRVAAFQCAHCPDSGMARFSSICSPSKKYRTQSCNCCQKHEFKRIRRAESAHSSAEERREMVDCCHQIGSVAAAERYGLSKAAMEILRKDEYNRIDGKSIDFRQSVYEASQAHAKGTSYPELGKRFDLTEAEVRRICFVLHAQRVKEQERLITAWKARSPEQRHKYEQILLPKMVRCAQAAIKRVGDADEEFEQTRYVQGRYKGEFSPRELTTAASSSGFHWVYDLCKSIPERILAKPWAGDLRCFMEIADRTLLERRRRQLAAIEKAENQPKRSRNRVTCPTDGDLLDEFPTPTYDHNTMIEAIKVRTLGWSDVH